MTISEYEALTGLTVTNEALVTAQIARTQRMLEAMLGYSLDPEEDANEYTEIGKTATSCPCPDVNMDTLLDPDEVVGGYRLYTYNPKDKFLLIDPASEIHAVKLVGDGITFRTFDEDEYRSHFKHGFIKYLEECENCCFCTCKYDCYCTQLAVDATWVTPGDDLNDVWADFITYYSDAKFDIKSETLGSHSYTRNAKVSPESIDSNIAILRKYAGPNGTLYRSITI